MKSTNSFDCCSAGIKLESPGGRLHTTTRYFPLAADEALLVTLVASFGAAGGLKTAGELSV